MAHDRGSEDDVVVLGAITRPHGVRGEVRVHRFNADSPLILELERVLLVRESAGGAGERRVEERRVEERKVLSSKRSGDADVLRLEGITRVEDAESLRGVAIAARRAWLPPLDDDELYHVDLVGMRVVEAGVEIGQVDDVLAYPSVDCLRVTTARGAIEIPILEPYVIEVDAERGVIEVAHTEDFEPVDPRAT